MKRVVVTGMGIVSSIGNNTQEVLASLRDAKSGISHAEEYTELGFRCQVHGKPSLDPSEVLDRRTTRFMGTGAAWNYIAMEQAIQDSGLEPSDVSNERTGIIMRLRWTVHQGNCRCSRISPATRVAPSGLDRPQCQRQCRPQNSATLATPFHIKGVNYSISSACATSNHLHRQCL